MSAVGSCADNASAESFFGNSSASELIEGSMRPALKPGQIFLVILSNFIIPENSGNLVYVIRLN